MNAQHFKAFLWLRWRIVINQLKRSGTANLVIVLILLGCAVLLSIGLFCMALLAGIFLLPQASPLAVLLTWDGLVLAFLFFWLIGLLTELQRSETLSLENFLHLPVSLSGVFLINYLGSWVSLSMIVFLPAMFGLALALVIARGPMLLLVLPVLASFLLVVTAFTHQFRGWLAALMQNKRRRRTVVVVTTMTIILLLQLPNLINVIGPWNRPAELQTAWEKEMKQLDDDLKMRRIDPQDYQVRQKEILKKHEDEKAQTKQRTMETVETWAAFCNLVLPPGWLPYGAMTLTRGEVMPALLAAAAMSLLGSASLRRSYRTTLRLYTGQLTASKARPATAGAPPVKASMALLERRLPWASEHASAIAVACFRSLTRAPEVKMILLTPLIMAIVFGSMILTKSMDPAEYLRPVIATGAMAMVLLSMTQLAGNQFGFDRSGFRTFVLSSAPRRDILLGKNLSLAPLALGLGTFMVALMQIIYPMRLDHFVSTWPQLLSMYLLFSLIANCLSILAPMPVAAGTLKPSRPKGMVFLFHLLFTFLFPLALAPTLLPLGIEFLMSETSGTHGVPVCLILSLIELAVVGVLYHFALRWLGQFLQYREQRILEIVTVKTE